MAPARIDLSVVLASAHPGAALDELLGRLLPQLAQVRGELVLVDGSPRGLSLPAREGVRVHYVRMPGADVFAMRAAGLTQAQGWVVTFAEDHCMPADEGWAQALLEAHRRSATSAALTGAVRNGTTATAWDRGSFLLTFAPILDPMPRAPVTSRLPPPANVSLKRDVINEYGDRLAAPGFVELELLPHLHAVGHLARAPEVRMEHHQGHRWHWFVVHHFHNGRATGGLLPRGRRPAVVLRRIGQSVRMVPALFRETRRELDRRSTGRADRRALAVIAALLCSHAAGQIAGILKGPGDSPAALE